jgi:TonB family protein
VRTQAFICFITGAMPALLLSFYVAADESPAPDVPIRTKPRLDHSKPLIPAGENDPALTRLTRNVVCKVHVTVNADGTLSDFLIAVSSGEQEIDALCLRAFVGGRLLPATENGAPVATTLDIPITWHPSRMHAKNE